MPKLKILHATTKIQHSQINKCVFKKKKRSQVSSSHPRDTDSDPLASKPGAGSLALCGGPLLLQEQVQEEGVLPGPLRTHLC